MYFPKYVQQTSGADDDIIENQKKIGRTAAPPVVVAASGQMQAQNSDWRVCTRCQLLLVSGIRPLLHVSSGCCRLGWQISTSAACCVRVHLRPVVVADVTPSGIMICVCVRGSRWLGW